MAELTVRVHRWPPLDAILLSQAKHVRKDARRTRFFSSHHPLTTLKWGATKSAITDFIGTLPPFKIEALNRALAIAIGIDATA
jgi:hypothetical protein